MNPKTIPSGQELSISGHGRERRHLESLVRTNYEQCHPDDSFEDLKRRALFAKEDRGLLRDWLATALQRRQRSPKSTTGGKQR